MATIRTWQTSNAADRVGVQALLVVDRDDKSLRLWTRSGGHLSERSPDGDRWHGIDCLSVRLRSNHGLVVVDGPFGTAAV